jgi:hypothetical protein
MVFEAFATRVNGHRFFASITDGITNEGSPFRTQIVKSAQSPGFGARQINGLVHSLPAIASESI